MDVAFKFTAPMTASGDLDSCAFKIAERTASTPVFVPGKEFRLEDETGALIGRAKLQEAKADDPLSCAMPILFEDVSASAKNYVVFSAKAHWRYLASEVQNASPIVIDIFKNPGD